MDRSEAYGAAALEKACAEIASTPEGGRNDTLNAAAYSIGRLVGGGVIEERRASAALLEAARACGLTAEEARATIKSGLAAGLKSPRTVTNEHDASLRLETSRRREVFPDKPEPTDIEQLRKAQLMWRNRHPAAGSIVEIYLRQVRGYNGIIPASIGFLPPYRPEHHPAMISAFAWPISEPEPGTLSIPDKSVCGVHLTLLRPDGLAKADTKPDKLMVGPSLGTPIVLAPMNDLLGLAIAEGVESGLSLYEATGLGVWAAGSASRMPALADAVPKYTDCVTIAAEPDDSGRKHGPELARRLRELGIHSELRFLGGGDNDGD